MNGYVRPFENNLFIRTILMGLWKLKQFLYVVLFLGHYLKD